MVFPVVGGTQATGDLITNSLRFNDDDTARLARTPSSAGNRKTWTWSGWIKRSSFGAQQTFFSARVSSDDNQQTSLAFRPQNNLLIQSYDGAESTDIRTTAVYRDPSAWYHIVVAFDTTQSTNTNRVKVYVNGSQETALDNTTYPDQNDDTNINAADVHNIGQYPNNGQTLDGYLAEVNFIDGQQLAPTQFGETNDNGVWVPIEYTGSYGTNGFYLQFKQTGTSANASGIGADTSGNDHHFTPTNLAAIDVTTDTPQNNFAVINSVWAGLSARVAPTLSEGNTQVDHGSTDSGAWSTIIPANGKWYAEFKITSTSSNTSGISVQNLTDGEANWRADTYQNAKGYQFFMNGNKGNNGTATTSYGSAWSNNDIIVTAMDLDNGYLYFSVNGTYVDSGDPTSGSSGTGAAFSIDAGDLHCIGSGYKHSMQGQWNFGNAPFSISSGNSDANGYGNFEYAVPSGYYALCTKNLAEYG